MSLSDLFTISGLWVEEHSLLPRFHGDKAAQKVVESLGPDLLGFKSLLLHPQA